MAITATISNEVNPKQVDAFNAVMGMVAYFEAVKAARIAGTPPPPVLYGFQTKRQFFYGGGIRGGKTFLYLIILILLCKRYANTRWHVIRAGMPDLTRNTEPSLMKILGQSPVRWRRGGSEYFCEFANGSRIYFMGESFSRDPDLNRFKGLETNGFLLEQIEELRQETWDKCIERAGSYYVADMPPPIILATFNPAFNWVKDVIYEPYLADPEAVAFHYTTALATDNSKVTEEQWNQWKNLDPVTYARYIEGMWEMDMKGRFMYAFNDKIHKQPCNYDPDWPLILSFDFNVDPATCVMFQTDKQTFFHIIDEVRIAEADTPAVCDEIKRRYGHLDPYYLVTGDASGLARQSGLRNHLSQYNVIAHELSLSDDRFMLAATNPGIGDSRAFCNSIWSRFPSCIIDERCRWTIHDLNFVEIERNRDGEVGMKKTGKLKQAPMGAESMGHLLDGTRYGMHNFLYEFVDLPRS